MKRRGRPRTPELLTARELEVLGLLREKLTNREIAERLGITLAGAKFHVSEIIGKLGVSSREEAVRWRQAAALPLILRRFKRNGLAVATCASAIAVVVVCVVLLTAHDAAPNPLRSAFAATPTPALPTPEATLPDVEFRSFDTVEEARAVAGFPIMAPAIVPDGYRVASVRYVTPNANCRANLYGDYCTKKTDFVEIRYEGPDSSWFYFNQGYGGSAIGGVGNRFAPDRFKGSLSIEGRDVLWVRGYPRSGLVDPGDGRPVPDYDWIDDDTLSLTWLVEMDAATNSRCMNLYSKTLTLQQLSAIAASTPSGGGVRPAGGGC